MKLGKLSVISDLSAVLEAAGKPANGQVDVAQLELLSNREGEAGQLALALQSATAQFNLKRDNG